MKNLSHKTLFFALLLPALSCGIAEPETDWRPQDLQDAGGTDAGFVGDVGVGEGPGAGTMSGTWFQVHAGSKCILGNEQVTRASYLVDITQTGAVLDEKREICSIELSKVLGLELRIPEATRESIDFIPVDYGQVTDLSPGGSYASSMEIGLWGVVLDDPILDEMPTSADDPRVVDLDGDGNPGVTFEVVGSDCERYQGQRQIIRYFGRLTKPNEVTGASINHTDIEVYGSSLQLCGIAPPVAANDRFSEFKMVRVDGAGGSLNADFNGDGEITCDEVRPLVSQVLESRDPVKENCE